MKIMNHWRNPIRNALKELSPTAWEIMHDKLEILDLRRCDFDGLFYPRCEMILTSFGLIAKQHAVKLFEPDECGNEYGLKTYEVTL
jgi:hypothetical protein